jgi:CPA1 family monovalent cation:H+ antiporter
MSWVAALRWFNDRVRPLRGGRQIWRNGVLVAWCGMRGIVTLAAALALPDGFPYRDLVLLSAVTVAVGTLVLQGFTLRPLIDRLGLEEDKTVAKEIGRARIATSEAALLSLDAHPDRDALVTLREEFALRFAVASGTHPADAGVDAAAAVRRAVTEQRLALDRLRRTGEIGEAAFHAVVEEIDRVELTADARLRPPLPVRRPPA